MSDKKVPPEEAKLRARSRATLAAQRRTDTKTALEALRMEQVALRERTAKLRALRLAKEAADADASVATPEAKAKARPANSITRRRRAST